MSFKSCVLSRIRVLVILIVLNFLKDAYKVFQGVPPTYKRRIASLVSCQPCVVHRRVSQCGMILFASSNAIFVSCRSSTITRSCGPVEVLTPGRGIDRVQNQWWWVEKNASGGQMRSRETHLYHICWKECRAASHLTWHTKQLKWSEPGDQRHSIFMLIKCQCLKKENSDRGSNRIHVQSRYRVAVAVSKWHTCMHKQSFLIHPHAHTHMYISAHTHKQTHTHKQINTQKQVNIYTPTHTYTKANTRAQTHTGTIECHQAHSHTQWA